jgi:PAS domain S-box-containing protein
MSKDFKDRFYGLEKKYRLVADNLVDAVWAVDADSLKFEFITSSIERLSGFTVDEFVNFTVQERLTPASYNKLLKGLQIERDRFEQGMDVKNHVEVELIHKSGSTFWVELTTKFFREPNGSVKVVGVAKDITQRKKADKEREELIEKLENTLAEKDELRKEINILRGLLPICAGCRRIRDQNGKWWPLDAYVEEHSEVRMTHTICPDCKDIYAK